MKKTDTLRELQEKGARVLGKMGRETVRTGRRQTVRTERQREGETASHRSVKVTVKMPEELVKALKHRAIDEGRTFQDLVTEAVKLFLGTR